MLFHYLYPSQIYSLVFDRKHYWHKIVEFLRSDVPLVTVLDTNHHSNPQHSTFVLLQ